MYVKANFLKRLSSQQHVLFFVEFCFKYENRSVTIYIKKLINNLHHKRKQYNKESVKYAL